MEIVVLLIVAGALTVGLVGTLALRREDRRTLAELRKSLVELTELAAVPAPSPSEPWAVVVARRVVVNLKTGRALDGVLVRRDGPLLFLKNAVLLEEGNEPAAIDGEAVVQAVDIDFIQAL